MGHPLLGLRSAIYRVTDLQAAKNWYAGVLGIAPYFDEPFYVGFNLAGYELGLHPADEESGSGSLTAYWGVADVPSFFDTLIAAGATAVEAPAEVGGDIIVASVKDPWGNLFGLIRNPHFKPEA